MKKKRVSGFTLIEILIAIFIFATATGVVLTVAGGIREQSYKTAARNNVRKVQEAYDQWLVDQPSVEYARSQFNAAGVQRYGRDSIQASYPNPNQIRTHLANYLDASFLADLRKEGNTFGVYTTRALEEAGGYMTIFWDPNYRSTNINVLITLP